MQETQATYEFYIKKINTGVQRKDVIDEARQHYGLKPDYNYTRKSSYSDKWIPFNLEREYVFDLIGSKQYKEAKQRLEEMELIYHGVEFDNFIEAYEQHLSVTIHADENIRLSLNEAKKEFNQHTITIISVVVGVITLLGTANQTFSVGSFQQGLATFITITFAILFLILITFWISSFSKK